MEFSNVKTFYSINKSKAAKLGLHTSDAFYCSYVKRCILEDSSQYALRATAERIWYQSDRPYYLVYPCILELVNRLPLETPLRQIVLPDIKVCSEKGVNYIEAVNNAVRVSKKDFKLHDMNCQAIALRFPANKGMLYDSILACFTEQDGDQFIGLHCNKSFDGSMKIHDSCVRIFKNDYRGTLGELLEDMREQAKVTKSTFGWELELRLLACLGLLVDQGLTFLERDLLSRDEGKPITPEVLDRAKRNKGLGWTLGKALERIPHTRRPHFSIRWTGPGRTVPKLRPIKGSIVKGRKLAEVPSGKEGSE